MIIVGGVAGLFGIMLFFGAAVINICALNSENVPYGATLISSNIGSLRDVVFRSGWKELGKRVLKVYRLEK
jgi:spore germination protein KA